MTDPKHPHPNEPEGRRGLVQARAQLARRNRPAATSTTETTVEAARRRARDESTTRPAPEPEDLG